MRRKIYDVEQQKEPLFFASFSAAILIYDHKSFNAKRYIFHDWEAALSSFRPFWSKLVEFFILSVIILHFTIL